MSLDDIVGSVMVVLWVMSEFHFVPHTVEYLYKTIGNVVWRSKARCLSAQLGIVNWFVISQNLSASMVCACNCALVVSNPPVINSISLFPLIPDR